MTLIYILDSDKCSYRVGPARYVGIGDHSNCRYDNSIQSFEYHRLPELKIQAF